MRHLVDAVQLKGNAGKALGTRPQGGDHSDGEDRAGGSLVGFLEPAVHHGAQIAGDQVLGSFHKDILAQGSIPDQCDQKHQKREKGDNDKKCHLSSMDGYPVLVEFIDKPNENIVHGSSLRFSLLFF